MILEKIDGDFGKPRCMKIALARIFERDRDAFGEWWGGITLAEKILFGVNLVLELFILFIIIVFGLYYLGNHT